MSTVYTAATDSPQEERAQEEAAHHEEVLRLNAELECASAEVLKMQERNTRACLRCRTSTTATWRTADGFARSGTLKQWVTSFTTSLVLHRWCNHLCDVGGPMPSRSMTLCGLKPFTASATSSSVLLLLLVLFLLLVVVDETELQDH